jgi:cell division protein FtsQ
VSTKTEQPPAPPKRTTPRVAVDPRLRQRWIAARRAEGQRRLRIVAIAGAIVVVLIVGWAAIASPFLDVDHIVVTGNARLTAEQIESASRIDHGDPMVWLDGAAAVAGIQALPWVRAAHVEREWPGTVKITITERRAAAWVDSGAGPARVDRAGRVLERLTEPPTDLPQIATPKFVPPVGATIEPAMGARVAGRLQGYARWGTRTITLTPGGVVLGLVNGPDLRLGEPTEVMTKVRAAVAVLNALDGASVAYIDVSVPGNPVAGPET